MLLLIILTAMLIMIKLHQSEFNCLSASSFRRAALEASKCTSFPAFFLLPGKRVLSVSQLNNKLRYTPTVTIVLKIVSLPCCSRKRVSRCIYNLQLSVLQSTTCASQGCVQQSQSMIPQFRLDCLWGQDCQRNGFIHPQDFFFFPYWAQS